MEKPTQPKYKITMVVSPAIIASYKSKAEGRRESLAYENVSFMLVAMRDACDEYGIDIVSAIEAVEL